MRAYSLHLVAIFATCLPAQEAPAPLLSAEVPPGMVLCGVAQGGHDRGPLEELALKSQVHLRPGRIRLSTDAETFPGELFERVVFGRNREVARPLEGGVFRRLVIPRFGGTLYRFTFRQSFALDSGDVLVVELVHPLQFWVGLPDHEDQLTVELSDRFFTKEIGSEPVKASIDDVPRVFYGVCGYPSLPLWETIVELSDGNSLLLLERNGIMPVPLAGPPALLSSVRLALGSHRIDVEDYWDLVFTARWEQAYPRYLALLPGPVLVEGSDTPVAAVELAADVFWLLDSWSPESFVATYLDAKFRETGTATAVAVHRRTVANATFLRGDADGDGRRTLSDPVVLLQAIFGSRDELSCLRSADVDVDGHVTVRDAILLLHVLLRRGAIDLRGCDRHGDVTQLTCDTPTCFLDYRR